MNSWTGLDFFIFLIFLLNIVLGMARGGMKEMISMLCLCAALVVTIKFTIPLTSFVHKSPLMMDVVNSPYIQNFMRSIEMPPLTADMLLAAGYCISLLICFVGTFCACEAVLTYTNTVEAFGFATALANRKVGSAFGATRGFVFVLVFIIVLEHLYNGNVPSSHFVNLLGPSAKKMDDIIVSGAPERYLEILQNKNLYNVENMMKDLGSPVNLP